MNCEIIAIGSELLTPYRKDTNSLYLTEQLNAIGVRVAFKTIVGDRKQHLVDAVRHAIGRVDIVITMGGLGPTEDDLTRESVAEALGIRLRRNQEIVAALYARFASRRIQITENNTKQADIIEGATPLPNPNGTAPGQWLDTVWPPSTPGAPNTPDGHRKLVILLPGPPTELKSIFEEEALPKLRDTLPRRYIATRTLKAAMIGESAADARIAPIYQKFPDVETTILAHLGDIQLSLICSKPIPEQAQARVDALAAAIEEELDDVLYSSQGETLERIVTYQLEMQGATLSTAESCTGGLVAERLTSISGSSRSFLGGAVVYSNELKTAFADVPTALLQKHGAVSREVAQSLADGIRKKTGSTYGIGITGIAGPSGGTEEKPVGLVYIALSSDKETDVVEKRFTGDRHRIRHYAAQQALDMIRRALTPVSK
jgi:nicotinamide-nucleotide amidase